jgi:GTP-binding protein
MLQEELPEDLPVVFISSVVGKGLMELKDLLWKELNSESNKLQAQATGELLVRRDRDVQVFDQDFSDYDLGLEDEDIDDEELDIYELEDLEDE